MCHLGRKLRRRRGEPNGSKKAHFAVDFVENLPEKRQKTPF
jgi:hypothetical protein